MKPLAEVVKDLLGEVTGLRYEVKQLPSSIEEPVWDVTMEYHTAMATPPYEAHEVILSAWGYPNGEIVFLPKIKNSVQSLAETLDRMSVGWFLLADRHEWPDVEKDAPKAVAFLRGMDKLADEVNNRHGSDVELHVDPEEGEWWLQARFDSKRLSRKEILPRIERNVKGLLEALKEYHKRIEALEEC